MSEAPTLDWVYVPAHIAEGPAQVCHKNGWLVCEVPADGYARLIAAAPDMLDALKAVDRAWSSDWSKEDCSDVSLLIGAAIAKAEGRS